MSIPLIKASDVLKNPTLYAYDGVPIIATNPGAGYYWHCESIEGFKHKVFNVSVTLENGQKAYLWENRMKYVSHI